MQRANYQFYDGLFDKLIFIPVEINGFHVTAMFDTGAAISIIANSLARKIKACVIENPLTAVNNNGKSFRIEKAAVSSINLGGITIENAVSGIIPDRLFRLRRRRQRKNVSCADVFGMGHYLSLLLADR